MDQVHLPDPVFMELLNLKSENSKLTEEMKQLQLSFQLMEALNNRPKEEISFDNSML
jgi:serine O-acetyltransferase